MRTTFSYAAVRQSVLARHAFERLREKCHLSFGPGQHAVLDIAAWRPEGEERVREVTRTGRTSTT